MMDPAYNAAALEILQSNLRHSRLSCLSNGVMEFWSKGNRWNSQHSITPILQHSNTKIPNSG